MYPEQLTGTAWEIQIEVSSICRIVLLPMLITEIVSWKQSQELHWLQDKYILPNEKGILHWIFSAREDDIL